MKNCLEFHDVQTCDCNLWVLLDWTFNPCIDELYRLKSIQMIRDSEYILYHHGFTKDGSFQSSDELATKLFTESIHNKRTISVIVHCSYYNHELFDDIVSTPSNRVCIVKVSGDPRRDYRRLRRGILKQCRRIKRSYYPYSTITFIPR